MPKTNSELALEAVDNATTVCGYFAHFTGTLTLAEASALVQATQRQLAALLRMESNLKGETAPDNAQ